MAKCSLQIQLMRRTESPDLSLATESWRRVCGKNHKPSQHHANPLTGCGNCFLCSDPPTANHRTSAPRRSSNNWSDDDYDICSYLTIFRGLLPTTSHGNGNVSAHACVSQTKVNPGYVDLCCAGAHPLVATCQRKSANAIPILIEVMNKTLDFVSCL